MLRSCFISAPAGVDTNALRHELEARGITWTDQSAFALGESFVESIRHAIRKSDFVCAVVPYDAGSGNVLFELGIAAAYRKPVLAFVAPNVTLSLPLYSVMLARVDVNDSQAVAFHLDAALQHGGRPSRVAPHGAHSGGMRTPSLWEHEARELVRGVPASEVEAVVAKVFEESGVVVSRSPEAASGPDMALWIDSLQELFGNPLLVEVKAGDLTASSIDSAEDQLRRQVSKTHGRAGLLIYVDRQGRNFSDSAAKWPLIIRLSFEQCFERLKFGEFEQYLVERRNRLVHGHR